MSLNIEQKLKALWKQEDSKNLVKACLFNLIIVAQKNERLSYFQDEIKGVIGKFPCRIIFISLDSSSEEGSLNLNIKAEMVGTQNLKVACELIEISALGEEQEKKIPFLILPNILPDLPVYLLWAQEPNKSAELLNFLKNYTTKVIFDAEASNDLKTFSRGILDLVNHFSINVGDVIWTALRGWRKIIASLFTDEDSLLKLSRMKTIRIHYNVITTHLLKHNEREAMYLQAWIAAQLKSQFESYQYNEGNIRISYQRPLHPLTFHLIPEEQLDLPAGSVLSVELESMKDRAHYVLKRNPEKGADSKEPSRQVFIHSSTEESCSLPFCAYLPQQIPGHELIDEIFYKESSPHYLNMLKKLSVIK